MKPPAVKICGITAMAALDAAIAARANYVGLVFWPGSRRFLSFEAATSLLARAGNRVRRVGLFVDADDATLQNGVKAGIDLIQLHGDETAHRAAEIRSRFGLPVIQAVRVADAADLARPEVTRPAADMLLFDAKVAGHKGGTGVAFDWTVLKDFCSTVPWMLSGGLNADNVRAALDIARPDAVDVSSGVEDAAGDKSPDKIRAFIQAVRQ